MLIFFVRKNKDMFTGYAYLDNLTLPVEIIQKLKKKTREFEVGVYTLYHGMIQESEEGIGYYCMKFMIGEARLWLNGFVDDLDNIAEKIDPAVYTKLRSIMRNDINRFTESIELIEQVNDEYRDIDGLMTDPRILSELDWCRNSEAYKRLLADLPLEWQ